MDSFPCLLEKTPWDFTNLCTAFSSYKSHGTHPHCEIMWRISITDISTPSFQHANSRVSRIQENLNSLGPTTELSYIYTYMQLASLRGFVCKWRLNSLGTAGARRKMSVAGDECTGKHVRSQLTLFVEIMTGVADCWNVGPPYYVGLFYTDRFLVMVRNYLQTLMLVLPLPTTTLHEILQGGPIYFSLKLYIFHPFIQWKRDMVFVLKRLKINENTVKKRNTPENSYMLGCYLYHFATLCFVVFLSPKGVKLPPAPKIPFLDSFACSLRFVTPDGIIKPHPKYKLNSHSLEHYKVNKAWLNTCPLKYKI